MRGNAEIKRNLFLWQLMTLFVIFQKGPNNNVCNWNCLCSIVPSTFSSLCSELLDHRLDVFTGTRGTALM